MPQFAWVALWLSCARGYEPDPRIKNCCPRLYEHRDQQPLRSGFLDPTKPPYSAAADGVTDDTDALQAAMNDAYHSLLPVVLPANSSFLLTKQLRMVQDTKPAVERTIGYQLLGSANGQRPRLRLKDHSKIDTGNTAKYKDTPVFLNYGVLIDGKYVDPIHYHSKLRNVDIDVGDNSDVVALSMSGAQLCTIQDVSIHGRSFLAGVVGLPGSGGYTVGLHVVGGQFGVMQGAYRDVPLLASARLIKQSRASILHENSRGSLVISGAYLEPAPSGVAIEMTHFAAGNGSLLIEDSMLNVTNNSAVAIVNSNGADLVLRNTYVKAAIIAKSGYGLAMKTLMGSGDWLRVDTYGYTDTMSAIWEDGSDHGATRPAAYGSDITPGFEDPAILLAMHYWNREVPVVGAAARLLDIADFGATPHWVDAMDDDGKAIQRALDEASDPASPHFGSTVFVPHGVFDVRDTLRMKGNSAALIGSGATSSIIRMADQWNGGSRHSVPMLVVDSEAKGAVLSDIAFNGWLRCTFFDVRAPNMLVRDVATEKIKGGSEIEAGSENPKVIFTGLASGQFFGLSLDHLQHGLAMPGVPPLVLVKQTSAPLHLYALSAEHQSGADPQILISGSSGVRAHALKFETPISGNPAGSLLKVEASRQISIFGGAGNCNIELEQERAIFEIATGSSVDFAGVSRTHLRSRKELLSNKSLVWDEDSGASVNIKRSLLLFKTSGPASSTEHKTIFV